MKKILLISGLAIALFLLINKFKKKEPLKKIGASKMEEPKYFFKIERSGDLIKDFVKFVQLKEGGTSGDLNDSASAYMSPYKVNGKLIHTNKGITYKTFKTLAPVLGYADTEKNFLEMPMSIWFKIFEYGYYKPFNKLTTSKLINLYISLWAWGSGVDGANSLIKKIGKDLQILINEKGEKFTLEFLVDQRIKFYERLVKAKPQNAKFLQGWKNAALSFYKNFEPYAKN